MRTLKKFSVLAVVVFALSVVGVASASAATFTASGTGSLSGVQTTNQEFTASSSFNPVICKKAATTGSVILTEAANQKVKVTYSECTVNLGIFGNATVEPIKAEYNLFASGQVEIENEIEIIVKGICTTKVTKGQKVGTVTYTPSGGKIVEASNVSGIHSTSEGVCPSGTAGTYKGSNSVELVGGTLGFDA